MRDEGREEVGRMFYPVYDVATVVVSPGDAHGRKPTGVLSARSTLRNDATGRRVSQQHRLNAVDLWPGRAVGTRQPRADFVSHRLPRIRELLLAEQTRHPPPSAIRLIVDDSARATPVVWDIQAGISFPSSHEIIQALVSSGDGEPRWDALTDPAQDGQWRLSVGHDYLKGLLLEQAPLIDPEEGGGRWYAALLAWLAGTGYEQEEFDDETMRMFGGALGLAILHWSPRTKTRQEEQ